LTVPINLKQRNNIIRTHLFSPLSTPTTITNNMSNRSDINKPTSDDEQKSSPLCCGTTEITTTTITSSPLNYWSEGNSSIDDDNDNNMNGSNTPQQISDLIANCLICFWPTMQSLRVGNDGDEDQSHPHNDCFVAVSSPSQLLVAEQNDWHHHASSSSNSTDVVENDESTSLPTRLHISIPPPNQLLLSKEETNTNNVRHQRPPRRLTPVTVQSQNNTTEEQHCNDNGGNTLTSNTQNTLHRRTDDISLGFFTAQTLDEIHVATTNDVGDNNTPRSRDVDQQQQQHDDNIDNNNSNHHRAFQTPSGNRVRLDSDSFRQTIKVVTCEKRRISDESDVSPIDSDAGFSPIMLDSRHRRVAASENLSSLAHGGDVNSSSKKRLLFDDGGDSSMDDYHQQQLSPLSEFGLSVMKSLQSIIQGGGVSSILGSPLNDKENKVPYRQRRKQLSSSPSSTNNNELTPWNDTFLPKSSTFLKALRRSGRRGKVLIQGWVAFRCRDDISWEDIIHNPKRCDFRYIILLDDMPILHMFTSRPRKQKKKEKPDLFKDCLSIDLSDDDNVAVRINHVSKELGNEVCIVNQDGMTNGDDTYSYSLLPISIPQNVFLDKHQSRLAKGGVLECVFEPELVNEGRRRMSFNSENCDDDGLLMLEKSSNSRTTTEQYDVARHLLFVLDATIFKSQ